jgi:hypothetical protein
MLTATIARTSSLCRLEIAGISGPRWCVWMGTTPMSLAPAADAESFVRIRSLYS